MKDFWVIGAVGSVVFHAVVLALVLSLGRSSDATTSDVIEPPAQAEVEPGEPLAPTTSGTEPVLTPSAPVTPVAPTRSVTPTPRPAATPAPSAAVTTSEYVVKSGDNLSRLARKFKTTPAELATLNGMSVAKLANLQIGQVIKVPATDE